MVELIVVGLNHKSAPLDLRERVSFAKESLSEALLLLRRYVPEGAILSTCNRTEIYAVVGDAHQGEAALSHFLAHARRIPSFLFAPHLYAFSGVEAARHLLTVAAGMDSLIVGEPQILGQVRETYAFAQSAGTAGKFLSLALRAAQHAGKRVRTETCIAHGAASVCTAAIELARRDLGALRDIHVAVIGAGQMGTLLAHCLADAGARRLSIVSRKEMTAQALAGQYPPSRAHTLAELDSVIAEADLAVTALSAPTTVLDRARLQRIMRQRGGRSLSLIDLAVPRNVAPDAREVPGIRLRDMDDLRHTAHANLTARRRELVEANRIVEEEVAALQQQWRAALVSPVIVALRARAEEIRQRELAQVEPKLHGLSDHQLRLVSQMTSRIVNKLLHDPTMLLRTTDDPTYIAAAQALFQLSDECVAAPASARAEERISVAMPLPEEASDIMLGAPL